MKPTGLAFALLCLSVVPAAAAPLSVSMVTPAFGIGTATIGCDLDGHSKQCRLDTGGGRSLITTDGFSSSYPAVATLNLNGPSGKSRKCDVIVIKEVMVAGVKFSNQQFVRCQNPGNPFTSIASDMLDNHAFNIDLINKQFDFIPEIPKTLSTQQLVRAGSAELISIPVTLAGEQQSFIFDTGMGTTLIDKGVRDHDPGDFRRVAKLVGQKDVTGTALSEQLYLTDAFSQPFHAKNAAVTVTDFGPVEKVFPGVTGALGFNLINGRNWYFDLITNVWALGQ